MQRGLSVLVISNLCAGVGVASGIAVGALLAQSIGGTEVAGLAQASSVLGAGVAAVPLAALASRRGRRMSLTVGYVLALAGAVTVIGAAFAASLVLLLVGLGLFGVASAAGLQSRFAATEYASAAARGRSISMVMWATTIGAVAGPNLIDVGYEWGLRIGVPALAGSYLFSVLAFAAAALVVATLLPAPQTEGGGEPQGPAPAGSELHTDQAPGQTVSVQHVPVGSLSALRWAMHRPTARFAVLLIACAHAVMVGVMVMTPVHMTHHGMGLQIVGVVISLHVAGMYAASPVFGWVVDRWGARWCAVGGLGMLALALVLGVAAAGGSGSMTAAALVLLGLGWSACLIAGSAALTDATPEHLRVPLQGASDAGMNLAGAAVGALAGPVLAWGGFGAVNVAAAAVLLPAIWALLATLGRARRGPLR